MSGQVGFVSEGGWPSSTAGTTPTKFMPVLNATPGNPVPEQLKRQAISARRIQQPGKVGKIDPRPHIDLEVSNKNGIATLFKHLHGGVSTGTISGSLYPHTFVFASTVGDSMTVQTGITDASETVRAFTAAGCKPTGWTLGCAVGEYAKLGVDFVARSVITATSLASASYVADEAFTFVEGTVSIGGTTVASARNFMLNVNKNLAIERFTLGSQYRREPVDNGFYEIGGSIECDFDDLTLINSAIARTQLAIVLSFTSGGAGVETLVITMSGQLLGDPPELKSQGLEAQTINFEVSHATADASAYTMVLNNTESTAA
jgi:hypothetical protein